MRRSLLVPLVFLASCSEICPFFGLFAGQFSGDLEGQVQVDVEQHGDDEERADVEVTLSSGDLEVFGSATIRCEDGRFEVVLQTPDNPDFGSFGGLLGEDAGDGEWSFNTGEAGTWIIDRIQ